MKEIRELLNSLKNQEGKSIADQGMIHSLGIDDVQGIVSIKLNLTQDYRKAKALIQERL